MARAFREYEIDAAAALPTTTKRCRGPTRSAARSTSATASGRTCCRFAAIARVRHRLRQIARRSRREPGQLRRCRRLRRPHALSESVGGATRVGVAGVVPILVLPALGASADARRRARARGGGDAADGAVVAPTHARGCAFLLMWLVSTVLVLAVYENRVPHDRSRRRSWAAAVRGDDVARARPPHRPGLPRAAQPWRRRRRPPSCAARAAPSRRRRRALRPLLQLVSTCRLAPPTTAYLSFVASIAAASAAPDPARGGGAGPPLRRRGDPTTPRARPSSSRRSSVALAAAR